MKSTFKKIFVLAAMAAFAAADAAAQGGLLNLPRPGGANSAARRGARTATGRQTAATPAPTAQPESNGKTVEPGGRSIEFNQAPVEMVFKVYGELKNVTVLKDPQTPSATITLQPLQGQELTDEDKIEAIETVLEMNGIHLEPYGEKFCRAIPRKDVRKDGIPLLMDPNSELRESTRVVSLRLPFHSISVEEAQKALEGFKSANGVLLVFERTNSIIITDTEANIKRMREIAEMIDVESPVTENVFVRQIRNASAVDIKTALEAIVQKSKEELEKNGKQPNPTAAHATGSAPMTPLGSARLLGRAAAQPAAPVNQPSLVTTVSDADRGMIRGKVLILSDERSNKLIIVTSKANMDFFDKVIEQLDVETTPPTVVKVYRLKYAEAEDVSDMINDLIGNAPSSKSNAKSSQNAAAKTSTGGGANMTTGHTAAPRQSANKRTGEPQAGELSKENTTVLADKRINGLVVMTQKELVPTVEAIIEAMDIKLSQVLIETVIIEVTLGDELKTGVDWVQNGRHDKLGSGNGPLYQKLDRYEAYDNLEPSEEEKRRYGLVYGRDGKWYQPVYDWVSASVDELTKGDFWTGNSGYAAAMAGGASGGASAVGAALAGAAVTNLFGSGINYIFKSDKLNLSAVIQATKTDNRAKYIASPIIMTVDNKEANIDATENRQFLTGWTAQSGSYGNSGQPTPNYSAKDIGIKLKIKPKINPNGTVMLNVEEEYSQYIEGGQSMLIAQGGNYVPGHVDLAIERKMNADVLLDNGQTVIFGGLTETKTSETESGIPILKDIPWIGKWLFGKVEQSEGRKELLVFMTPYVLNDGEEAQVEAMRRKKAVSDPRPWDDHGWSLSELADPVSKREMLRRLKDEWAKQDEDRKTKLAIEKAKVERVKKLKEMSKAERDEWLEMHKEELEKEQQKELEEKMLDDESQEELKKLADEVRERKLKEAMEELDAADEEYKGENARSIKEREDAAKKAEKSEAESK